jgi:hypothetical protein
MEMSQANQIAKSVNDISGQMGESQLNPLLLSLKEKGARNVKDPTQNAFLKNVFGQ